MTSSALLIAEGGGDADDDVGYGSTGEQEVDRAHTGMGMFGVSELRDLPNPSPLAFAVGRRPPGRQQDERWREPRPGFKGDFVPFKVVRGLSIERLRRGIEEMYGFRPSTSNREWCIDRLVGGAGGAKARRIRETAFWLEDSGAREKATAQAQKLHAAFKRREQSLRTAVTELREAQRKERMSRTR